MFEQYHIWSVADRVRISGTVEQSAKLDADGFFKALLALPSHRCLDLLRLALGIHAVDRVSKRKRRRNNEDGIRQIRLAVEVRDILFWRQPSISGLLVEILSFLTCDDWRLDFEKTRPEHDDIGHQDFLSLPRPFQPRHAALYSGGLDSAAGLANRLLKGDDHFILVTVGHHTGLHRRVEKQLKALGGLLEKSQGRKVELLHSTLTTSLVGGKSKRLRQQERTQRSRAFLFCAAATVAAKAYGIETIDVFENGVGAINVPLMTGMFANGFATRGAHPTFLKLMSELSVRVTESPIRFVLPFEMRTKAEMLDSLTSCTGLERWAQESRSCVHTSLRQKGKTHCGRCPACIERRQAFACANIVENLDVYQTDALVESTSVEEELDYLSLYRLEAMKWIDGAEDVRRRMTDHLRLTDISAAQDQRIIEMHLRHSSEVLRTFGPSFAPLSKLVSGTSDRGVENGAVP